MSFEILVGAAALIANTALLAWLILRANHFRVETFRAQEASRALALQLERLRQDTSLGLSDHRDHTALNLKMMTETITGQLHHNQGNQLQQFELISRSWTAVAESNERRMQDLQKVVEERLHKIQDMSASKLEAIRETVDEKLQSTLERRLGESFKLVSDRLEHVQRGLGEMQSLATGVGDLKRVLTNVKTRGTWGEIQLASLLEQMLTIDQYSANVKLGQKGTEIVEFAVRLPGTEEGENIWLPIDSKFPQESYQRLIIALDEGNMEDVVTERRTLELAMRSFAKDIACKYICPPNTTDFAIMFLPTEGLYAEVLRMPGLVEKLQVEHRIALAGPTTLTALLNSLQMGFKTLAIQKRSSEVWKVLGAVKSEFGRFGDMLSGVQKKLTEAANKMDEVTRKTKTIQSKLRNVEEVAPAEVEQLLARGDEETLPSRL